MSSSIDGLKWKETKKHHSSGGTVPMIPSDLLGGTNESVLRSKFSKAVSNPFVPAGLLATVGCLLGMCIATKNREVMKAQYYMRGRIAAQAFTVSALVIAGWNARSEFQKKLEEEAQKLPM